MFLKQREFEEARKELQMELEKGASVDEIRKKITKGEIQTKAAKKYESKQVFRTDRIHRKNRDLMKILNKHATKPVDEAKLAAEESVKPISVKAVELFAKAKEGQDGASVLNKSIYRLNDKDLLVRQLHAFILLLILLFLQRDNLVGIKLIFKILKCLQGTCDKA